MSIVYSRRLFLYSVQFSSVTQLCPTLCNPINCSTPGLPVHHQLPEFTQTHAHRVSDAIQPSHPLSSPSPPAPNPSQHQSLFQWVNSSHEVAKVLASVLASITRHIHSRVLFLLWLHPFILSGVISPLISSSILGTYWLPENISKYCVLLLKSTSMVMMLIYLFSFKKILL